MALTEIHGTTPDQRSQSDPVCDECGSSSAPPNLAAERLPPVHALYPDRANGEQHDDHGNDLSVSLLTQRVL
jgi:hypothetical protein